MTDDIDTILRVTVLGNITCVYIHSGTVHVCMLFISSVQVVIVRASNHSLLLVKALLLKPHALSKSST
jgi:hypothetical protein